METEYRHGKFVWRECIVEDVDAAREFYAKAFYGEAMGWTAEDHEMPGTPYGMFMSQAHGPAGGLTTVQPGVPPHWAIFFAVDDCDATIAAAMDAGGSTLVPAMDIPPGRFAVLADPQGAAFGILKPNLGN